MKPFQYEERICPGHLRKKCLLPTGIHGCVITDTGEPFKNGKLLLKSVRVLMGSCRHGDSSESLEQALFFS